jgi:PAS domain S-box-containing protein
MPFPPDTEADGFGPDSSAADALLMADGDVPQPVDADAHLSADLQRRLAHCLAVLNTTRRLGQIASWQWHVAADRMRWSGELFQMLGCEGAEPIVRFADQARFYTPDSWARLGQAMQHAADTGRPFGVELEFVQPGGRHGWLEARGEPLRDACGQVLAWRGTAQAIGARIIDANPAAEAILGLGRDPLSGRTATDLVREQHAMLDNDLVGIVRLRERRIVWVNRALAAMSGYLPQELIGQSARLLYADEQTFESFGRAAYAALREGRTFRQEAALVRKDGNRFWVDVHGAALPLGGADSLWLMIDITTRRQAEALHMQAIKLEIEKAQALEAGRLKSQFLASVSHELRTPLNAIIGLAHVLASGMVPADTPKHGQFLAQIGASGRQLLQLIEGVLDLAAIEAGQLGFRPVRAHLPTLVHEVLTTFDAQAADKRIRLSGQVDADVDIVEADPERFKQVLRYFVDNALKFTAAGGWVALRVRTDGPTRWRLEVEDGGIGIAAEDLPRLFTPFGQLSQGNTKAYGGAGLSLALARRLVEAQGGTVGARSQPGQGSVFHAVWPRQPALVHAASAPP